MMRGVTTPTGNQKRARSLKAKGIGLVLAVLAAISVYALREGAWRGARADTGQPVLSGLVTEVVDGDTIVVRLSSGPIRVRLHAIDAPEHDQPWGVEARRALAGRVRGHEVTLDVQAHDSYGRLVADVYLGEENIDAWLVQQGDAWAYRHYLDDERFCAYEAAARTAHLGLWSLPADTWRAPWEWRQVKRGRAASYSDFSGETAADCVLEMQADKRARDIR
jgi:micrococcal nuclease